MLRHVVQKIQQYIPRKAEAKHSNLGLQIVLWSSWTLVVLGVAVHHWYIARRTHLQLNITGLVIDCLLYGLIGLVVITKIEMWIEPWRFFD